MATEIVLLRTGDLDHIGHLFGKVLSENRLATIASRMVSEGSVAIEAADPDFRFIQALGLARRDGYHLRFRNTLYSHVASVSPQLGGQAHAPQRVPLFALPHGAFHKVADQSLREIAWSAHNGAVAAYKAGSNRLSLSGFGASLEAMLLDLVLRQTPTDLAMHANAANCSFSGSQRIADPKTWTLFNLIKVGGRIVPRPIEPPQALREWRNTIHPAVCLADYKPDPAYEPEVRVAAALHEILVRDLP